MKNRGIKDNLIACVEGLKGFLDAVNSVFPQTHIKLCIIHMARNSLNACPGRTTKPSPVV